MGQNQRAWFEGGRAPGEDAVQSRGIGGCLRGEAGQSLPGVGIVSVSEATVSGREDSGAVAVGLLGAGQAGTSPWEEHPHFCFRLVE